MTGIPSLRPACNVVTPVGMLGYGLDEVVTADSLATVIPNGAPTAISRQSLNPSENYEANLLS